MGRGGVRRWGRGGEEVGRVEECRGVGDGVVFILNISTPPPVPACC